MNDYKHFLITRFNLKVEAWKTTKNAEEVRTEAWLKNRFELFESYCLPSVMNQTNQHFVWYVFFDVDTPDLFRGKVDEIAAKYANFRPVYIDGLEALVGAVTGLIEGGIENGRPQYVITTRMDNDDIIHKDFIKRIQEAFVPVHGTVIDAREGYQLSIEKHKSEVREYTHPFNAFVSVIEKSTACKTVLSKMHYDWAKSDNVIVIDDARLWIELVHQRNKMNATRKDIKKIVAFDYEDFKLKKESFEWESKYAIYFSNALIDVKRFLIKQVKRNKRVENIARKMKGLVS